MILSVSFSYLSAFLLLHSSSTQFPFAIFYFTGPDHFNRAIRNHASLVGFSLSDSVRQHNMTQHDMTQYNSIPNNTSQYQTTQLTTKQHSTTRYDTTQQNTTHPITTITTHHHTIYLTIRFRMLTLLTFDSNYVA